MTLTLACGGGGIANPGFYSEVCRDDWSASVQAGFSGGAAGRPGWLPSKNINLISSLYCLGNNTEENSDWSKGFRDFHSIKSVHLVICDACLGGVMISQTQRTKVSWCPRILGSCWFISLSYHNYFLFHHPAIRKTYRDVTVVTGTHFFISFAAPGNRWQNRDASSLISPVWKQTLMLF